MDENTPYIEGLDAGEVLARNTPGAILLDVRTPEEYAAGHLAGSVNLPLDELDEIDYPLNTPLFVYCRSGARSGRAAQFLRTRGYSAVNIGGILTYHGTLVQS